MVIFLSVGLNLHHSFIFGISARDLSISQTATLVGILPSPGSLRPNKYPERALEKRNRVLQLMRSNGYDIGDALQDEIVVVPYVHPSPKHPSYVQLA